MVHEIIRHVIRIVTWWCCDDEEWGINRWSFGDDETFIFFRVRLLNTCSTCGVSASIHCPLNNVIINPSPSPIRPSIHRSRLCLYISHPHPFWHLPHFLFSSCCFVSWCLCYPSRQFNNCRSAATVELYPTDFHAQKSAIARSSCWILS